VRPGRPGQLAAQFADTVRHLCASLDATEWRLLELRVQGHSTAELGLNAATLRVRLSRQRQRAAGVLDNWL
jgi:hypothetical protein